MNSRALQATVLLIGLLIFGTIGYCWIEGWSVLDGLYMTVITISTVGYGEPHVLSPAGKIFTGVLILVGVSCLAYIAARTTDVLLRPGRLNARNMRRRIERMQDHVIVCGFGRMGANVAERIRAQGVLVVVVDNDPAAIPLLEEAKFDYVSGDATDDSVLESAGLRRAMALATVLPSDSDNLFITLSGRALKPDLTIVSRSSNPANDRKMRSAGATRVLNPFEHGGLLMAQQLLQPTVTEFLDIVQRIETELDLTEVRIGPDSPLAGVALQDSPIRREHNVIVVGIRSENSLIFNPPGETAPEAGDVLVILGRGDNLTLIRELAQGSEG
jgi:voltage-gated potassium channel